MDGIDDDRDPCEDVVVCGLCGFEEEEDEGC